MAETFSFELVSPERLLMSKDVAMVVVPGAEGDFGVLPEHALFMSQVRPGVIEIYEGETITDRVFVAGGFAEVNATRCTVLAEEAIPVEDLTQDEIGARQRAVQRALDDAESDEQRARAEAQLTIVEAMDEAAKAA